MGFPNRIFTKGILSRNGNEDLYEVTSIPWMSLKNIILNDNVNALL